MTDATTEKYAFLELNAEVAEQLGLPEDLQLPMRTDKFLAATESGELPLADLADGLIQYLGEHEEAQESLYPALGPVAAHAAFAVAAQDEFERANRYFGIAVEAFPDDLLLRASFARSFLFLEDTDAALVEYLFVLDHPDREFIDFVWYDAALLLAHADDFDRAEQLLEEFLKNEPGDEQAEKLLRDIREMKD